MMEIVELTPSKRPALIKFFKLHPYRPFAYIPAIDPEAMATYLSDKIFASCQASSPGGKALLAVDAAGEILGLASCQHLDFDSRIYDRSIFRLSHLLGLGTHAEQEEIFQKLLEEIFSFCRKEGGETCHTRVAAGNIPVLHLLEQNGFQLMDILLLHGRVLSKEKDVFPLHLENCHIRPVTGQDIESLIILGHQVYSHSHFYADPKLPKERTDRLYAEWITNSCLKKSAQEVLVAEMEGEVVGFLTCSDFFSAQATGGCRIGSFGIMAVNAKCRNRGIGTLCLSAGIFWFLDRADYLHTGTHVNNYPIQRALTKVGFKSIFAEVSLHKWF